MKAKLLSLALLLTVTASYADLDCEQEPYKSNPDFQKTCQELLESIQDAKKENLQRFSKQLQEKRGLVRAQPITGNSANANPAQPAPAPTYSQPANPPTYNPPAPVEEPAAPSAAAPAPAKPTNRIYY